MIYNHIYIQCLGGYINEYMNRTNVSTSVNDSQWGYNLFPVILLNTPRNHWFGIKTHIWNPFRSSILGGWDYLYTYVYIYICINIDTYNVYIYTCFSNIFLPHYCPLMLELSRVPVIAQVTRSFGKTTA